MTVLPGTVLPTTVSPRTVSPVSASPVTALPVTKTTTAEVTDPKEKERVASMTLAELQKAGLVVEVYSSVLQDRFLLASDDVEIPPGEERACYTVSEMEGLLQLPPDELQLIHAVKGRLRCRMTVQAA